MQVSVVLATYNRAQKLKQCLESVFAQTLQSVQYEVIVVDDGSTDATLQVLQEFRDKYPNFSYHQQQNQGPATARNQGAKKAKTGIIAFTDDDCLVPKNWLQKLLSGLGRYPQVAAVGGYQEADDKLLKSNAIARFERFQTRNIYCAKEIEVLGGMETPAVVTNNMAVKKQVFNEVGGFDESFPVAAGEDADLKKRITDKGYQLLYIPLKVVHQQDYSLSAFLRQSFVRGIGSRHFQRKWSSDVSNKRLLIWLVVRPFKRFWSILELSKNLEMSSLAFLQEACGLWGQLKYDSR